jgi:hypothetical protein
MQNEIWFFNILICIRDLTLFTHSERVSTFCPWSGIVLDGIHKNFKVRMSEECEVAYAN